MPKIDRVQQKIFAENSGNLGITEFGTAKQSHPTYTKDLSVIQNDNFTRGWSKAILSDKAPYEEDSNGLYYMITTQLAYLFQQGIPEYDINTTYYKGSLAKVIDSNGDVSIYKSVSDENTGQDVTNSLFWIVYLEENPKIQLAQYEIGLPQPTFNNNLLANEIWLEGQAVSRTAYKALFDIYGTTYGAGDGATTFNLPNCLNRVLWGASDFGYIEAGLPNLTASAAGAHTHTRGTMNITANWGQRGGNSFASGAVYLSGTSPNANWDRGTQNSNFHFDASRNWTGATSSSGEHTHAITSGLRAADTVQPPAIKCRVKTRWY